MPISFAAAATAPSATFLPPELKQKQLTYQMLKASSGVTIPPSGQPEPIPVLLNGSMAPYVWKINQQIYPKADPIPLQKNRLVQFQFTNQTMMPHPMHLHGHFFQVENGTGRGPMKDTVLVDPMQKMNIAWYANNPGQWAFHCHNQYHLVAGMFRVVSVS